MNERKPYLDHIRWGTVLLVLVYHVGYLFNGVGILGGIPGAETLSWVDGLLALVYPWFMVLLFVVSGICARYALEKQSRKQFLRGRARKLLIPSTLGLFVIHWITGYLNIKLGGGLEYIPGFLLYPISVLSGIGPLWFIQTLFLFSAVLVLIRKLDRHDRLWTLGGKAGTPVIVGLAMAIWAAAQVGNMPVLTMYRFGIYFTSFMIGYLVFSHDEVQEKIEGMRLPAAISALILAGIYLAAYSGENYTQDRVLRSLITNGYLWFAVLVILGMGKRYAVWETAFTRYMTKNSYGFYILHYPVLMVTGYLLHTYTSLPAGWKYLLTLLVEFAGTFFLNELVKRIPVVRYLILGQKTEK